jgi:hypothetical protein
VFVARLRALFLLLQRIKDWAVKMKKPEVPFSTIEECARHADIIGVSVPRCCLFMWVFLLFAAVGICLPAHVPIRRAVLR